MWNKPWGSDNVRFSGFFRLSMFRLNSAKFSKISLPGLNCHFWGKNHKNYSEDEFLDFYEFADSMIFDIFLKMVIPTMAIYVKNFKNHLYGELVTIRKIVPIIIFVIFIFKNDSSGTKWNFWNFSEFSLSMFGDIENSRTYYFTIWPTLKNPNS